MTRAPVFASRAMVASPHPLASLAGVDVLRTGGSAMDAGSAMATVLNVVDPAMTGVGGDLCLLYYSAQESRLIGLSATGPAPREASIARFKERGITRMPFYGPLTITVPGALDGWSRALERYGRRSLADLLEPAIHYAEAGFPVGRALAAQWDAVGSKRVPADPDALRIYAPGGRFPDPGEILRQPELAQTLRLIAKEGPRVLYEGSLGRAIVDSVRSKGGLLSLEDLAAHRSEWVEPIAGTFSGLDVRVLPPHQQGVALLEQLHLLDAGALHASEPGSAATIHLQVEVAKLALKDLDLYVTDPDHRSPAVSMLLSPEYLRAQRARITPNQALQLPIQRGSGTSHTTCMVVVDAERNALVLLNSLRNAFGSAVVATGTGILLQNRGRDFSLDPEHVNHLAPGKRTLHTLNPVMLLEHGRPRVVLGAIGAFHQTQSIQQVLVNHLIFGMDLQGATDAPRWAVAEDNRTLHLEPSIPASVVGALVARGHDTVIGQTHFGGTHAIAIDHARGVLTGAADPRYDGIALGF